MWIFGSHFVVFFSPPHLSNSWRLRHFSLRYFAHCLLSARLLIQLGWPRKNPFMMSLLMLHVTGRNPLFFCLFPLPAQLEKINSEPGNIWVSFSVFCSTNKQNTRPADVIIHCLQFGSFVRSFLRSLVLSLIIFICSPLHSTSFAIRFDSSATANANPKFAYLYLQCL